MGSTKKSWDGNERSYYNFTTLDTFLKIYNSGKVRLTPCNSIKNSAVEVMFLYSAIKSMLKNDQEIKEKLFKIYSVDREIDIISKLIDYREQSYMVCFSKFNENNEKEEVSNAEYLWKFYADNSQGVVIKFNHKCYPYKNHGSQGGSKLRSTEIRMDCVIYRSHLKVRTV